MGLLYGILACLSVKRNWFRLRAREIRLAKTRGSGFASTPLLFGWFSGLILLPRLLALWPFSTWYLVVHFSCSFPNYTLS